MRLSVLGDAAMGNGSGETSVNGAVPSTLQSSITGDPRWYSNSVLVFQVSQVGSTLDPGLSFIDLSTDVVTVIQSAGANRLAAGGGVWADFLAIGDGQVTTSYGATLTGAGLGDVGEDGALATLTNYITGGITTYDSAGIPQWSDAAALRFDSPTPVRSGLVAYCDATLGWRLRAMTGTGRDTPYVARLALPFYVVPITLASGAVWVLEQTTVDGGNWLTLRAATENKGYTIAYGTNTFNPDARELSPGVIRVGWSTNPQESADALELMDLTIATGANTTATVVSSALNWIVGVALSLEAIDTASGTGLSAGRTFVSNPIPPDPIVDRTGRLTKIGHDYFQGLSQGNAESITFRQAVPKAVQLPAFRSIGHGVTTPLYARDAGGVSFESSTIEIVLDPVTQQVQLNAKGGGGGGIPGIDGEDGLDGPPGIQGLQGPQGPAGPTGASGAGILGPMGLTGDDGDEGMVIPGPQGPEGPTGPAGSGAATDATAFGSEPGSPNTGDLDLYTNSFYIARYSGSAWLPWGPIFALTPPVDGDFAWINQGGASVDASQGGIHLNAPATAGDSLRLRVKSAPATPYTITVALLGVTVGSFGIAFRQSSDGKLAVLDIYPSSGLRVDALKFTNPTTFSAAYTSVASVFSGGVIFLRIADDGVNRISSYSADGQFFVDLHSVGRTDFLTADQVGFFVNSQHASIAAGATVISWAEA